MTCAEFDRWLDEGRRETELVAACAHADACARCAAALEAALAIEAAFSEGSMAERALPPTRAPEGFASRVMARLADLEPARAPRTVEAPRERWWIRLLTDPVAAVSSTAALLALGLMIWNPPWMLRLGGPWLTWMDRAGGTSTSSTLWLAILATAAPLTLWLIWQTGRALERAMVLQVTRPDV
jgi:hypothetical protein